jgi:hypothetical protein
MFMYFSVKQALVSAVVFVVEQAEAIISVSRSNFFHFNLIIFLNLFF